MMDQVRVILENSERECGKIKLGSHDYKELIKSLNPIAKEFVQMLGKEGFIKADKIEIVGNEFWGLRANVTLDEDDFKYMDKLDNIISQLEICPKVISINGNNIDLFFQSNQSINLKSDSDYTELVFSFIDYIREYEHLGIKFIGWNLKNDKHIVNIPSIKSDSSFTKDIFDTQDVEIYDFNEQLIEF